MCSPARSDHPPHRGDDPRSQPAIRRAEQTYVPLGSRCCLCAATLALRHKADPGHNACTPLAAYSIAGTYKAWMRSYATIPPIDSRRSCRAPEPQRRLCHRNGTPARDWTERRRPLDIFRSGDSTGHPRARRSRQSAQAPQTPGERSAPAQRSDAAAPAANHRWTWPYEACHLWEEISPYGCGPKRVIPKFGRRRGIIPDTLNQNHNRCGTSDVQRSYTARMGGARMLGRSGGLVPRLDLAELDSWAVQCRIEDSQVQAALTLRSQHLPGWKASATALYDLGRELPSETLSHVLGKV